MTAAARRVGTVTGVSVLVLLLAAASAFAYWKTTGSGTGNATAASTWTEDTGTTTSLSIDTMTVNSGHTVSLSGVAAKGTTGDGSVSLVLCKVNTWPCPTSPTNQVIQTITITQANITSGTGAWSVTSGNAGNNQVVYARATQPRTAGTLTSNVKGPVTA